VLRRTFGPKREGVVGGWIRPHNEELNKVYSSLNISRVIKSKKVGWAGNVARMVETRHMYKISVGRPEWKGPLVRFRFTWKENIRMGLRKLRWEGVDWIHLTQNSDRWRDLGLENMVMNLRVPQKVGNLTS